MYPYVFLVYPVSRKSHHYILPHSLLDERVIGAIGIDAHIVFTSKS